MKDENQQLSTDELTSHCLSRVRRYWILEGSKRELRWYRVNITSLDKDVFLWEEKHEIRSSGSGEEVAEVLGRS